MLKALATIEGIPGVRWNAHLALGDAAAATSRDSKVVVLFLDAENHLCMRAANVTYGEAHLMLSQQAARLMKDMA